MSVTLAATAPVNVPSAAWNAATISVKESSAAASVLLIISLTVTTKAFVRVTSVAKSPATTVIAFALTTSAAVALAASVAISAALACSAVVALVTSVARSFVKTVSAAVALVSSALIAASNFVSPSFNDVAVEM